MRGAARLVPPLALVVCLAAVYPVQRWIDRAGAAAAVGDEYLFLTNGEDLKRLSLGYHQLLSDVYWLRAVQYFGRKVQADPSLMNERGDKLKLLYPLVDVTTTLDPQFTPPYRFGGYFVHDYVDPALGLRLLDKGIANNPSNWFLYQDKALLLWSSGDCAEAARVFDAAAGLPGAPSGARALGPSVLAGCGDIDAAAATYARMEQEFADDPMLRDLFRRKRAGLQAQAEVEALTAGVETFRAATGAYPPSLPVMLRSGALPRSARIRVDAQTRPVDPLGVPYLYDAATGSVGPGENGVILPPRLFTKTDAGGAPAPAAPH